MTDKPTVVFDLDGTLADTIPDLVAALNRTLAGLHIPPVKAADVAHLTGKGGLRAMIAQSLHRAAQSTEAHELDTLFQATAQNYGSHVAVDSKLYPGVIPSLNTFQQEGWQLAICTNKPVRQAIDLMRAFGIEQMFATIAGVDSFDVKKPDPRHLTQTIKRAGGQPHRSVMVGDTINDIQTAKAANIPVIAVDFGYSDVPVGDLAPDRVISTFDDLFAHAKALIR